MVSKLINDYMISSSQILFKEMWCAFIISIVQIKTIIPLPVVYNLLPAPSRYNH